MINPINFIEFFMHIDKYLGGAIQQYGIAIYIILFLIIFCETGLVITPILPGDSLLFAAGTFAAIGSLNIYLLFALLFFAAVLGDNVNYWIGHYVGPKVFKQKNRFFKKEYLDRTKAFYAKYGVKAIIIGRFIPIIRTFSPFVAGVGRMKYSKFLPFDIFGGLLWVGLFVFGGYFFGNISIVKENFSLVILGIIFLSILPGIVAYFKHRK
jgi:membrane-associated protein